MTVTKDTTHRELDDNLIAIKKRYTSEFNSLKLLFSANWSDADLLAILDEVVGDLDLAISRISEGIVYSLPFRII